MVDKHKNFSRRKSGNYGKKMEIILDLGLIAASLLDSTFIGF